MPTVRDDQAGFLLHPIDLHATKGAWLEALDSVEPFVAARPPNEVGCLYYSASQQDFIDPREAQDAAPHYGRPGGVLPRITDA